MSGFQVGPMGGQAGPGGVGPSRFQRPLGGARGGAGAAEGASFKDALSEALNQVSGLQDDARDAVGSFLRGEPVEVHQVMAAAEEAGIALEMLIEVRNKLTEAYRAVVQMQS